LQFLETLTLFQNLCFSKSFRKEWDLQCHLSVSNLDSFLCIFCIAFQILGLCVCQSLFVQSFMLVKRVFIIHSILF
jgi:hypothetical protein